MSLLNTRDLIFFDKNGAPYNFEYNEEKGILEGCVYIDPISRGLYETQALYFMQKFPVYSDPSNPTTLDILAMTKTVLQQTNMFLLGMNQQRRLMK